MTSLSTDFTDKLFADYEANAKYSAIENAVTHNGLLKSIETRQSEVENDHVFSIDLTKDEVLPSARHSISLPSVRLLA